jgi:hypothetical protein
MPGDNIPESMGEDFSESVGEDISEQAGAIVSESVGSFPRNQQSGTVRTTGANISTKTPGWEGRLPALSRVAQTNS